MPLGTLRRLGASFNQSDEEEGILHMKKRLLAMMALFALVLTAGFAVGCGDDDDDTAATRPRAAVAETWS